MQMLSLRQPLLHVTPFGEQPKGSQLNLGPGVQVPLPSQTETCVMSPSEHEAAEQVSPCGEWAQPPMPSHAPVCPQVDAGSLRQMACGSGAPAATGMQVPTLWTRLQLTHGPSQALVQQAPSTQKPLAQSAFTEQGMTGERTKHDPFTQGNPPSHWASLLQDLRHVPDAGSQE